MQKDVRLYGKQVISFVPTNPINIPEVFVDITNQVVPGILPYYMISNYGRIWHKYRCEFLTVNIDSGGYLYKPLVTLYGQKNYRVHRLVLLSFDYFKGCENLPIRFKDNNRANPCLWNLGWGDETTIKNTDENAVRLACELLQNPNNTIKYIAEHTGLTYNMVQAIQNKRSWVHISKDYDIKERKVSTNFDEYYVIKLCEYYRDFPKPDSVTLNKYCAVALCVALGIVEPKETLIRTAKKIYNRETFRNISRNYNF